MQCCGSEMLFSKLTVESLETAKFWYPNVQPEDLPIIVEFGRCYGCGRIEMKPFRRIKE